MTFNVFNIILRFVVCFLVLQLVAVAGGLFVFKQHRNRRAWFFVFAIVLYLNAAYYFLFNPPPETPAVRTAVEYLLLYPFFAYMLVCIVLLPLFAAGGILFLPVKLYFSADARRGASLRQNHAADAGRREFMKMLTSAVALPMAGSSLYGSYIGKNRLEVENVHIAFSELPGSLDGFTIAQISDIHVGPFMDKKTLAGIVDQVNGLDADIAVITGDIINWGQSFLNDVFEGLAGIRARSGVFAVLGNHDYYCNTAELCAGIERAGVRVLRDEHLSLVSAGGISPVYLGGIDDPLVRGYAAKPSRLLQKVMCGVPEGGFKVLLSHRPTIFDHAAAAGIQLTLSGHTHAGQFVLPDPGGHGWSLARLRYERDYGLYRQNNACLYINRGIGVVGPPVRINCPREITRIVLHREE